MGRIWPEDDAERIARIGGQVLDNVQRMDVLGTLRCLNNLQDAVVQVAGDVIEIAGEETALTQSTLANALGVPASTLRGLRCSRWRI